jgi:hypothetical protein
LDCHFCGGSIMNVVRYASLQALEVGDGVPGDFQYGG